MPLIRLVLPLATIALAALSLLGCNKAPEIDEARLAEIHERVQTSRPDGAEARTPPPFEVASRIAHLEEVDWFPCSDCHEEQDPNPNVRRLRREHDDIDPGHGNGRFWCLSCHHPEDKDYLVGLDGSKISFDESFKLCGSCHFEQERDFLFGAHGRRVGGWLGDRTYLTCVECHDPHTPKMEPRQPLPPPSIRPGLDYEPPHPHGEPKPWVSVLDNRIRSFGPGFMGETAEAAPRDGGAEE
jgi:hypothetical protein